MWLARLGTRLGTVSSYYIRAYIQYGKDPVRYRPNAAKVKGQAGLSPAPLTRRDLYTGSYYLFNTLFPQSNVYAFYYNIASLLASYIAIYISMITMYVLPEISSRLRSSKDTILYTFVMQILLF